MCRVVLASSSPRRRQLLNLIGIAHEVRPANIDESPRPREAPRRHAERLAREKASAVSTRDPGLITIGADTVVVINRTVLGKPADGDEAARMLGLLSGREHLVITAVAVSRGEKLRSAIEEVRVKFRRLRDDEIQAYIATGEPMDKAGAYGIQGFGATIVERIEGDYFAVMGLPLVRLVGLLRDVGVNYRFGDLMTSAD
ncbi:MAG: septum formation protein Maf [Gemmatimonadetes bacterium]|nr:MAG: septum formation protein Maf [Gemmatimonadota bacterium]PYP53546.1 MAG: septum formation protein Maf [Gemmatimonadota bacterium]